MSDGTNNPPAGGDAADAIAAQYMSEADKAKFDLAGITRQIHGMSPFDPRFRPLHAAQTAAAERLAVAQGAAPVPGQVQDANLAIPTDPSGYGPPSLYGIADTDDARADFAQVLPIAQREGWRHADLRFVAEEPAHVIADPALAERQLKGMWGSAYDAKIAEAKAEVQRIGPEFVAWLERTGYGNSPRLIVALLNAKERRGGR